MTRNKMPRWLSEGISVYEEEQANPTWGQRMNPKYREMVLGGELTPISKLSGAFLAPRTPIHLQFAYYESSLVVEYLVQKYGLESLKGILTDLGTGEEINKTIEKHTAALDDLEKEFAAYVTQRAQTLAPGLDWEKPKLQDLTSFKRDSSVGMRAPIELSPGTNSDSGSIFNKRQATGGSTPSEDSTLWVDRHPTNYYALTERAGQLIAQKNYEPAKQPLKLLVERYPTQTGPDCAYVMLAAAYRALSETNAERELLDRYVQQDDEANDAYLRLAELDQTKGEWTGVMLNAQRSLAVDPLASAPYGFLARASGHLDDLKHAIQANRALLLLDPPNPAEVHFQLAEALDRSGDTAARRQVLQALEDAPRFRQALQLLLKLHDSPAAATTNSLSGLKP